MKQKKHRKLDVKTLFSITVGIILILAISIILWVLNSNLWWQFETKGEINTTPTIFNNNIYLANNNGVVFSIKAFTGKVNWIQQLSTGNNLGITPHQHNIIISTQDGLYSLHQQNGNVIWHLQPDNFSQFVTQAYLYHGNVYIGDTEGTIYAVNPNNGKLLWKFSSERVDSIDQIVESSGTNWFGSIIFKYENIYFGSRDGTLYVIDINSGKVRWQYATKDHILTTYFYNNRLYLGTSSGKMYLFEDKSGRIIDRIDSGSTGINCIFNSLFMTTNEGKLLQYDTKINATRLVYDLKSPITNCPIIHKNIAYISDQTSRITAIDLNNGKINKQYYLEAPPSSKPFIFNWFSLLTGIKLFDILPFGDIIVVGDSNGIISAIRTHSGKLSWQYNSENTIQLSPSIVKGVIYGSSNEGRLIKINAMNGKNPYLVKESDLKIDQLKKTLDQSQYLELTLTYPEKTFPNPWTQIKISTDFYHQEVEGMIVNIKGFYYDKNTWKVRFNPPKTGTWKWIVHFKFPDGREIIKTGEFVSQTDTKFTYLRNNPSNPSKLTADGVTEFNLIGFQNSVIDLNGNGSPFDDWSLGTLDSEQYIASLSGKIIGIYPSKAITDTDTFISKYSQNATIFNIFRYGFGNASATLFKNVGSGAEPINIEAKKCDFLFDKIKNNSLHLWLSLFSFNLPFPAVSNYASLKETEKKFLNDYIDYVVARYGIYVDIWEINNEIYSPDTIIQFLSQRIRQQDYEKRPITTNWEKPNLNEVSLVSIHDYQSDFYKQSDIYLMNKISAYTKYGKPIIFSELGNKETSWDKDSTNRMRIKLWTALFNQASIIFWNESSDKTYHSEVFANGNIFIGPEERKQVSILNQFTQKIPLSAKRTHLYTNSPQIRGYGIETGTDLLGYFVCEKQTFHSKATLPYRKSGTLTWINPQTGNSIGKTTHLLTNQNSISIPECNPDVVFKYTYD